jgi:signal transduction histidine kinase
LYPVELQRGVGAALQDMAANVRQVFGIACRCDCELELRVPEGVAAHLYRIAQEAVNNAIKHGRAPQVLVSLQRTGIDESAPHPLTLRVEDNGSGFNEPGDLHKGMGLRIMEYRSRMIGGTLRIQRGAAGGTVVSCIVPDV